MKLKITIAVLGIIAVATVLYRAIPNEPVEPKLGAGVITAERGYIDFEEVGIDTNEHNYLIGLLQEEENRPNPKVTTFNNFDGTIEEILLLKLYALDDELDSKLGAGELVLKEKEIKDYYDAKSLLADAKKAKIKKDKKVLMSAEDIKTKYNKYKLK